MDSRDWNLFLQPYEQAVEEMKVKFKTLRSELKAREAYAPIEFVTGRVKKISSILEKARRLGVPMEQLETGIEDIAGIRIMCQFVDDINRVAAIVRTRQDLKLVYEKDYVTNYKDSGYRSYHMIVEYPVQTALGFKKVLAEVQIRTLAMNFWATIEHSLNYKYKQSLPDEVRLRLRKAAEAAFNLDNEMSSIRREILDAQIGFEEGSNIVGKVLSDIQDLYFYRRVREAVQFQLRFNELWEQNDTFGLKQLLGDIQTSLLKARRGSAQQDDQG
ncbi:GTP pyrophosphokinase family protein [Paenibacillus pasadenensis]|uniref:GTP pyrophosphokinase n=1 Tax=Paenibacillus pasadenensis TaxID=217090 RepID=UPI00203CBAF7|nr:GTP pyrophosphokinase family protein [Paenibacillus pasadenensis]MCM3747158.1 GTP pyrophosphokinase family protein [Paenibacillus pasadenensis]